MGEAEVAPSGLSGEGNMKSVRGIRRGSARLLLGAATLALLASLAGCDGPAGGGAPATPAVREEIKKGQREGFEQFMKDKNRGGGMNTPGGPAGGGAPGAPGGTGQ
jgi:hypothetical protein